jgi:cytochrome c oxidase assembly protein subunit 11
MKNWSQNTPLTIKLAFVALAMFGFGYLLVPIYNAFCDITGVKILARGDGDIAGTGQSKPLNTQVDTSREITVEFDTNVRGAWFFKPERHSMVVHPGQMATVMYEFQNLQPRTVTAQAIPSYAPELAANFFQKVECFCFNEYTLAPGEKKSWPVVFVVHPDISNDVKTITLSYTFFEVGGKTPPAPTASNAAVATRKVGA